MQTAKLGIPQPSPMAKKTRSHCVKHKAVMFWQLSVCAVQDWSFWHSQIKSGSTPAKQQA